MKAKDVQVGMTIPQGVVKEVLATETPYRIVVVVEDKSGEIRKLSLFKDAEIEDGRIFVDREAIVTELANKLYDRLEYGARVHGEYWEGNDTLTNIEEELLDALVYLWIKRKLDARNKPVVEPFEFAIGDTVKTRHGFFGQIREIRPRNSEGQLGYVVESLGSGERYTAIRSELKHA